MPVKSAENLPVKDLSVENLFAPHNPAPIEMLQCGGVNIAARHRPAAPANAIKPPLIFLGGYRSDMEGTKAQAVEAFAEAHGLSSLRFDYSGHGRSGGDFYQGNISLWLSQALAVYEHFYGKSGTRPILIGTSMGGWISLRMAEELHKRGRPAAGLVLLAPAPDFTETLIKPALGEGHRRALAEKGFFTVEEDGVETPYSRSLLEDGPNNQIMGKGLVQTGCPVHIIQGMADESVPYTHTLRLMEYLPQENVTLTLVKDGNHRLSRSQDIALLQKILENCFALL